MAESNPSRPSLLGGGAPSARPPLVAAGSQEPGVAVVDPADDSTLDTSGPRESQRDQARPSASSSLSLPVATDRPTSRASLSTFDAASETPARLQMAVAVVLGLVLLGVPLYLWRRPRAESLAVARSGAAAESSADLAPPSVGTSTTPAAEVDAAKPTLTEVRVLACQDPGTKRTPAEQCDHVVDLEKALTKAVEETTSCVPKDAGGGTIQYVADVSFAKRSISIATPRDGRSLKNHKVAAACGAAVKTKLHAMSFESLVHQHARYKLTITATYPGPLK